MKETCYFCRYFQDGEDNICVRHAPIREANGAAAWPIVDAVSWCGDWEKQKEDEDE